MRRSLIRFSSSSRWRIEVRYYNIIALVIAVIALSSVCASNCAPEDDGMMVVDGVVIAPAAIPWCISEDGLAMESNDQIHDMIIEATRQWNSWLGFTAFSQERCSSLSIDVSFNLAPSSDDFADTFGFATMAIDNGVISDCDITISSDVAYHGPTVYQVLLHEMGHCIGLGDDVYSIDLNSVMSYKLLIGGEATLHDVSLIQSVYQERGLL